LKLRSHLVIELIEEAISQNLLAAQGAAGGEIDRSAELTYSLSRPAPCCRISRPESLRWPNSGPAARISG
jgi:hypothetical protein